MMTTSPETIRGIESRFMAPCCWHENLAVHNSPVAAEMRAEVAALALNGASEEQIVDRFVSRYGERILAEPRGHTLQVLTATPVALTLIALCLLSVRLRRRAVKLTPGAPSPANLPDTDFDFE
jgi:cytochrome c-type biogenesis protein CcmH/NrfF